MPLLDLSVIGKDGYIIQYEDIVSAIGFNIARYYKKYQKNEKLMKMSDEDIFISYINRETYSIEDWLKQYDIDITMDEVLQSKTYLYPNFCYTFRVVPVAKDSGVNKFIVHSNEYSPVIEAFCKRMYDGIDVEYRFDDIVNVLKENPNCTYITSSISNIEKCEDCNVPFVLVVVDDYMYLKNLIANKFEEKLKKKNILVYFTGIISAGVS